MKKILVVGAGIMGTTLAVHLSKKGRDVNLWGTKWDSKNLDIMAKTRSHGVLEVKLPENITFYYDYQLEEAARDSELIVVAVSSEGVEPTLKLLSPYIGPGHTILSITKGIEKTTLTTMSEVIEGSLYQGLRDLVPVVKLGGPIIAKELAHGFYSGGVFASKDLEAARKVQAIFETPSFKTQVSSDIRGVDICAAFKNVYAISMGIAESFMKNSNNIKAALLAAGIQEISTIVEAYGGSKATASGLAGAGDLYVTSQGGRNGIFGRHLGEGRTAKEALNAMEGLTVEGYSALESGHAFLKKLEEKGKLNIKKDTPLFYEVYQVVYRDKPVSRAISDYWSGT